MIYFIIIDSKEKLPYQRVSIAMYTAGLKPYDNITLLHLFSVDDLRLIYCTYGKACEVILLILIKAGHLRSLSSYQGAARIYAAVAYPFDNGFCFFGVKPACADVVKEKQGLCSVAGYIIYTHSDTVNAYGVMLIHHEGYLKLCSYSVGSGDQNRLFHA
ncbi:hypothetical protein SDC9_178485 [bioreactor metagenome]|uniref:Uncharacterized protein n=1 Tax=bioreactor metagenome TaxID=1076179 RepID=A0A645H3W4_9ZZZZ